MGTGIPDSQYSLNEFSQTGPVDYLPKDAAGFPRRHVLYKNHKAIPFFLRVRDNTLFYIFKYYN